MKYASKKATDVKIAYIGGGSRGWAWTFMTDLAQDDEISGRFVCTILIRQLPRRIRPSVIS